MARLRPILILSKGKAGFPFHVARTAHDDPETIMSLRDLKSNSPRRGLGKRWGQRLMARVILPASCFDHLKEAAGFPFHVARTAHDAVELIQVYP